MEDQLALAKKLAHQAGKLIKDNFESNLTIEVKPDSTPVTHVDKAINDLISQALKRAYPDYGLRGEEADHGTGKEEFQWICDPLDGTKAFILGVPLNTFILGLTKQGEMILSVVYNPFTDRLYHAIKGQGAFCNDQPIRVNQDSLADGGYVLVSGSALGIYNDLKLAGAQPEPVPGAGYRCTLLASGRCSGIIQGKADFHDVGPASLLIEEAGGKVTDYDGSVMPYDQPITNGIILSNTVAHDDLVKIAQNSLK